MKNKLFPLHRRIAGGAGRQVLRPLLQAFRRNILKHPMCPERIYETGNEAAERRRWEKALRCALAEMFLEELKRRMAAA